MIINTISCVLKKAWNWQYSVGFVFSPCCQFHFVNFATSSNDDSGRLLWQFSAVNQISNHVNLAAKHVSIATQPRFQSRDSSGNITHTKMAEVSQKWCFSIKRREKTDSNNAFIHDSVSILAHRPLISLLKTFVSGEKGFIFRGRRHALYEWPLTMTNQKPLYGIK